MKQIHIYVMAILLGIAANACQTAQEIPAILNAHPDKTSFTKLTDGTAKVIDLFNGKDLSGWYTYTQAYGKNNDVEKAFAIEDGVLHFAGEAMGYLCTNETFKNYYLRVVFRWGEKKYAPREDKPRDSGILYHFADTEPDQVWPTSIECQVQENDCGDYFLIGGVTLTSPNTTVISPNPSEMPSRVVRTENFENPNPEWNTIEVICFDDKSEHYVNGRLVNQGENLSVTAGKILLQLEGAEIYYKTVELLPLK
jgi:hypothetical protein